MSLPAEITTPEQLEAFLSGPAGAPPAGIATHFEDPPNLSTFVILTVVLAEAAGSLAVLLRMYTKLFIIRSIAYEDYAVVLGWILQIGLAIPSVVSTHHGAGFHMWDIQLKTFFGMLYWTNLAAIFYCPVVFLVKLSILLQYLRIFVPNRKGNMSLYVSVHILIWSCFAMYSVSTLLAIAQCNPRKKIWSPFTPGRCINSAVAYLATSIFNVITDFAILFLPMPCLWRLQISNKKKVWTTAIFATGSLACVTSILRAYYASEIVKSHDISYNVAKMGLWTFAEVSIGTMVCCAPVLPKFFRHFGTKLYGTFSSKIKSGKDAQPQYSHSLVAEQKSELSGPFKKLSSIDGESSRDFQNRELPYPSSAMVKRDILTVEDDDTVLNRGNTVRHGDPMTRKGHATKRNDLEK